MKPVAVKYTTAIEPNDIVTLADLKTHLRVDHDDEDAVILLYRNAAISKIENLTNRKLDRVTAEFFFEEWDTVTLPVSPVVSITSIGYKTDATTYATLSASQYWCGFNSDTPRVHFNSVPSLFQYTSERIKITAEVGYDASAGETPEALIAAVRMLTMDIYEMRGDTLIGGIPRTIPNGIAALISEYRNLG